MMWPDGRYPTSMTDYVYNLTILVLTYGIPMIVMLVCYSLMGRVLWGSRSIGENTDRQIESMKSKRKVVRMFIAIVSIFAICWLPYHMFFIYAYHNNQVASTKYVQHMYLGFYWLAMSNAMVNPIIYYWMNKRFRMYFQRIIFCCCLGLTRYKFDSPKSRLANKNSSNRNTRVETKSQWKRSTMETQIQQVPITSSRERQAPGQALNHMAVECIIERPMDDNSSPICLSINNSMGERQHVRIKYISCDEDNNPIEEVSEGNSNQSHSYSHSHSHSHGHNHTHRCTHSQNKTGIQQL